MEIEGSRCSTSNRSGEKGCRKVKEIVAVVVSVIRMVIEAAETTRVRWICTHAYM